MFDVGKRIKELREKENLSAEALGKEIGVSKQSILDMERKKDINTMRLRQLSTVFNVSVTYFFQDEESKTEPNLIDDGTGKPLPSYDDLLGFCKTLLDNGHQRDRIMDKLVKMLG